MHTILVWVAAYTAVGAASPLAAQQPPAISHPEVSRGALLQQILPKLTRTVRDPYSIRNFTLCSTRSSKLEDGRPDCWSVFFSFNAKNSYGGYVGIRTWLAVFRKGQLSGELIRSQLHVTEGLIGLLNRPLQREVEACSPLADDQVLQLLSSAQVRL